MNNYFRIRKEDLNMKNTNKKANVGMSTKRKTMDTSFTQDLESLIPEEERAITETTASKEVTVLSGSPSPVVVIESDNLDELLPEEERAVISKAENEIDKYQEAEEQGYFSMGNGMARIDSMFGDKLYASVEVSKTGERTILFCQQYKNGKFSPKVRIKQADLLLASKYNYLEDKKAEMPSAIKTKINRFIADCYTDYLGKFDGEETLELIDILKVLVQIRSQLPMYYEERDILSMPKALYQEVVDIILGNGPYPGMIGYEDRKSYFGLSRSQFEDAATRLGTSLSVLARKFKEYGFLYLTDSADGYQTKVRIKPIGMPDFNTPVTENLYCVLKLDYISEQRRLYRLCEGKKS